MLPFIFLFLIVFFQVLVWTLHPSHQPRHQPRHQHAPTPACALRKRVVRAFTVITLRRHVKVVLHHHRHQYHPAIVPTIENHVLVLGVVLNVQGHIVNLVLLRKNIIVYLATPNPVQRRMLFVVCICPSAAAG